MSHLLFGIDLFEVREVLRGHGAFNAARDYASGNLEWQVPLDSQVADLDRDEQQLVGILNSGRIFCIDMVSGEFVWDELLTVENAPSWRCACESPDRSTSSSGLSTAESSR